MPTTAERTEARYAVVHGRDVLHYRHCETITGSRTVPHTDTSASVWLARNAGRRCCQVCNPWPDRPPLLLIQGGAA